MTAAQYPATGTDRCLSVTGRCVGPQPAWLLQDCAGWATCQLDPASVQNAAARLIFDLRRSEHNGRASQSSLASCSRAHPLQSRRTYYLLTEQWITVLQCTCCPTSPELLTCYLDWDSDRPPPTNWLFHLTTSLVSVEGPFQFGCLSLDQSHCTSHISTVAHGFPAASWDFSSGALILT